MKPSTPEADNIYMQRCLQLAALGRGMVAPNPMVGAVVVHQDNIIGEGYHRCYGASHAEVIAIGSVKQRQLLPHSTLYVSLEPCSHYGKTPPCTQLIIKEGIKRVVIGCRDPFPQVSGRGIAQLRAAGVEVVCAVEEEAAKELNQAFVKAHTQERPYILLKWAETADGFMDILRTPEEAPLQISSPLRQQYVHQLRTHYDAIMVGSRTALMDNPSLTSRLWYGKHPLRIVIDRNRITPSNLHLYTDGYPTRVYTYTPSESIGNTTFVTLSANEPLLKSVLRDLCQQGIQSLMVEGGSSLLQHFIDEDLFDEIRIGQGNIFIQTGIKSPKLSQRAAKIAFFDKD